MLLLKIIFTSWALSAGIIPAEWSVKAGVSGGRYEMNMTMAQAGTLRLPATNITWTRTTSQGNAVTDALAVQLGGMMFAAPIVCDGTYKPLVTLSLSQIEGEVSTARIGIGGGSTDLQIEASCK